MNLVRIGVILPLSLGLVGASAFTTSPAHAQTRTQADRNSMVWGTAPSPNHGTLTNTLLGVSAVSAADIWSVGEYNPGPLPNVSLRRTLTEHWNGQSWTVVPSPNSTFGHLSASHLTGVDALASNDVWAVGYGEDFGTQSQTLTLHWDGVSWSKISSPNPGGTQRLSELHAVAAVAANDVWAVGRTSGFPNDIALTLHWNGSGWATIPNGCRAPLTSVVAISAQDVWAVGINSSCHYNGSSWLPVAVAIPTGQSYTDVLVAVDAAASDDVWAVGEAEYACGESICAISLVERWDGTRWAATPAAVPGATLNGVVVLASNNVDVVGGGGNGNGVIGHWDGSAWSTVPSPQSRDGSILDAIDAVSATNLWAVGSQRTGSFDATLIEQAPSSTQGTLIGATRVAGATISWFGTTTGSTTADVMGHYNAAGLPAGTYTVVAAYSGCVPDMASVHIAAGGLVVHNFDLDC